MLSKQVGIYSPYTHRRVIASNNIKIAINTPYNGIISDSITNSEIIRLQINRSIRMQWNLYVE